MKRGLLDVGAYKGSGGRKAISIISCEVPCYPCYKWASIVPEPAKGGL
jgi:hypothetical protein